MQQKFFQQQKPSLLAFVALLAGNISIAFGPLLVRFADSGPIATGFWRLALATPFLLAVGYRFGFRMSTVSRSTLWLIIVAGVFFGVDIVLWHIGIFQTKMANATIFANCASLLLVVYGVIGARKMPSRWEGTAILFAFLGAGLTYTVYLVSMIKVRQNTESWGALGMASAFAAVVLLACALFAGEQIIPAEWWPVVLLAFTSQFFGQGCLTYALPHFSPLVIGLALLLQPALSAAAGWLAFGETLTAMDFTGSALVMLALVLVRKQ